MTRSLPALLGLAALLACGCGGATLSPLQTVERYLDALARDPIRSLSLVSDDFQRRHGMRFEEVGEGPPRSIHFEGAVEPEWGEAAREAASDPALDLERARLGWLTTLTRRVFARHVPEIGLAEVEEEIAGDLALVDLRARFRDQSAAVRFVLSRRNASANWRIDAIEIADEAALAPALPYLLAPTAPRHRRVQQALGRRGRKGTVLNN